MPEVQRSKNYRGKCIICGDSTVGKSSLTQVFCSDGSQYPKTYLMTTGVDMVVKNVNIPETPDTVEIFIYDLAGKDIFDDIVQYHLSNIQMFMLVYDVTNMDSFNGIENWYKKIKANADDIIPGVLVANKVDLVSRQVVAKEDGEELAEKLNLEYFQCSAKEMIEVEKPFLHLAAGFYDNEMKLLNNI